MNPLAADQQFFSALIKADTKTLERMLTDDFILIDVMTGSENSRHDFLAFVDSGQLKFESIKPAEQRVRLYQTTALITGRTEMKGRLGDAPFASSSRYTHVYIAHGGEWRLASAQGTPISLPPQ